MIAGSARPRPFPRGRSPATSRSSRSTALGPPRLAFDVEFIDTPGYSYDVTHDGQRLLIVKRDHPMNTSQIELVTNWTTLLDRKP